MKFLIIFTSVLPRLLCEKHTRTQKHEDSIHRQQLYWMSLHGCREYHLTAIWNQYISCYLPISESVRVMHGYSDRNLRPWGVQLHLVKWVMHWNDQDSNHLLVLRYAIIHFFMSISILNHNILRDTTERHYGDSFAVLQILPMIHVSEYV